MSDRSGQACAFMAMTPIVPGQEDALRAYLEALPQADSPLARVPGTHFARWVILTDWVNDPEQPREDHLSLPHLLFSSNLDGPLDAYLDALCEVLQPEAREIWGRCVGCPDGAAGPELKAYLMHNRIRTGFFVAAYGKSTLPEVKEALALRERLSAFAVAAQGSDAAALQRSFHEAFGD